MLFWRTLIHHCYPCLRSYLRVAPFLIDQPVLLRDRYGLCFWTHMCSKGYHVDLLGRKRTHTRCGLEKGSQVVGNLPFKVILGSGHFPLLLLLSDCHEVAASSATWSLQDVLMCCAQSRRFKLPWIEPMKPHANLNPLSRLSQVFYQGDTKLSHSLGRSMRRTVLTHCPVVPEIHQIGIQHQTDHSKPTKEQPFLYVRGICWTELVSSLRQPFLDIQRDLLDRTGLKS